MSIFEDISISQEILTPEFLELDRRLKQFNVFNATDMKRREIKHTKFLAHLLDPNESHGLGTKFLESFLIYLSQTGNASIDLLSLDLTNAEIFSEMGLESKDGKGKTIDLLMLIPNLLELDNHALIAIEAKVESKGSSTQLNDYRDLIVKNEKFEEFSKYYYYLTVNAENVDAENWNCVSFSDVVVPSVDVIIKSYGDTISDYLLSILNDYKEVIEESRSVVDAIDDIAGRIKPQVLDLIKGIDSDPPFRTRARVLKNKYFAAIDFLKRYDSDPRVKIFSKFEKILKSTKFDHQQSSRTYLRFSCWSEENKNFLEEICHDANDKWLKSNQHLAFEFRQDLSETSHKVDISLVLVLGPTSSSFSKRNELHRLLALAGDEFLTPDLSPQVVTMNGKSAVGERWARVISAKKLKNFNRKGLSVSDALDFIENSLMDKTLIDLALKLDNTLTDFRENKQ